MFNIDLQLLVLSEGRSLLPVPIKVPLRPQHPLATTPRLSASDRHAVRRYLDLARAAEYTIPDDVQAVITAEFSDMRQRDAAVTGDTLHELLGLARLVGLLGGR